MVLKVKEEQLGVETLLGENTAQSVLQATVELPAQAFDVARVIWFKGQPVLREMQVAEDKVVFEGVIDLRLVYEGESDEERVLKEVQWPGAIPFSHYLEVIGAEPEMQAKGKVETLGVDFEVRPDQRSFDVDVLALFNGQVYSEGSYPVVTSASVKAPHKLDIDDISVTRKQLLASKPVEQLINEDIAIPEGYPAVETVLELTVRPEIAQTSGNEGVAKASGYCDVNLLYADAEQAVHYLALERKIPFQIEAENPAVDEETLVSGDLAADVDYNLEDQGRSLALVVDLVGKISLFQPWERRIIINITSTSGKLVETRKETARFDTLVGEKTQQGSAHGVIELSDDYPPIRELLAAEGFAHVNDYRVEDDKVYLEGSIDVALTYLAHTEEENKPLHYGLFKNVATIQQMIAVGGAQPGMHGRLSLKLKEVRPDLINRETVEVDFVFKTVAEITQAIEEEVVVEALEVPEAEEDPPTITYVIIQPNDSLWKLAKRYHTTEEAIYNANSWLREGEGEISVGDKLCIPRKPEAIH